MDFSKYDNIPYGPFLEEWKEIENTNSKYFVSNYGNIKTIDRIVKSCWGSTAKANGKIHKKIKQKLGYLRSYIAYNSGTKKEFVHRLVAIAFIPNPENKPIINHIRGFTDDNLFTQIEWSTGAENRNHGFYYLKTPNNKKGKNCPKSWKSIIGTNILTGEQKIYEAVKDTKKDGFLPNAVSECLKNTKGYRHSHKKFKWEYK